MASAKTYIPELDGLRAIAVLLVLGFHADVPFDSGGFIGVDVFFVLSGFLITTILRHEFVATGDIRFSRFYLRRLRRLYPPLVLLVFGFLLFGGSVTSALRAVLYLNDVLPRNIDALNHTWSLAVEEHYYLVWPLLLFLILRYLPRHALAICFGLFLLTSAFQFASIFHFGAAETYERLDIRIAGLMLGSTLALYLAEGHRIPYSTVLAIIVGTLFLDLLPLNSWDSDVGLSLGMVLAEFTTALLIASVMQGEKTFRFLAAPALTFLGRISYGIYLFHVPFTLWMTRHGVAWWIVLPVGLTVALSFATLSYYLVELPLQRMTWLAPAGRIARAEARAA